MGNMAKGNLLIIGGAEDKSGECIILKHLSELAGGGNARVTIITTASENPVDAGIQYREVFFRLGVGKIRILNINTRDEANMESISELASEPTCIFFTGGDQLRITSILGGTRAFHALHDACRRGTVIAGTSAGASVMSGTMIIDGNSNDPARKCTLKMAPGLGLLEEALIDQHFHQRGRIGRLLAGVAENPNILGIGIDEDTAVRVSPDAHFEVLGSNSVTIVDGMNIKSSNVSELKPDENLAITNVTIHVLPVGYGFDMQNREVLRLH